MRRDQQVFPLSQSVSFTLPTPHVRSIFIWQEQGRDRAIPFRDNPDPLSKCRPIGAQQAATILYRLIVGQPVLFADLSPVANGVADKEQQRRLARLL